MALRRRRPECLKLGGDDALNVISFQVLHTGPPFRIQKKFENEICRHFLHRKAAAEAGFVRASSSNWTPQPRQRRVAEDAGATA